jgi:hypothetical protein
MRATTRFGASLLFALAGCQSDGGAKPKVPPAGATIHLGDDFSIVNDTHEPICVTGVLLEGAGPPQLLYHGILAGSMDATLPAPPLQGKLLRLRFAASTKDGGGSTAYFAVERLADAPLEKVPEIARTPGVSEYLLGTGERDAARGPLELHIVRRGDVRRGDALDVATKSGARVRVPTTGFEIEDRGDALAIYRIGSDVPLLVQRRELGARPCLHPLMAPDLDGVLTEFSPDHHHHQTGVYFGLPGINGKSWFHRTREGAFHRVDDGRDGVGSAAMRGGTRLRWSVSDDWIGDHGPVLTETQRWELADQGDSYLLDLDWSARAVEKLDVEQGDYGGLFVRMPWTPDGGGHALNSEGQKDAACEGQRARWIDVEVPIPGRKDGKWGHIAMLDHPLNAGHPTFFRLDDQFGFGLALAKSGGFTVDVGQPMVARMRLVVYLGGFKHDFVEATWKDFAATR